MATEFNLPGSSFDEVQKILKGYNHASQQASLDQLSKITGLHSTVISRNNKFLSDVGLISGGIKKSATELGKSLGRALDHGQLADARSYWREAVQSNEKVLGLVATVRIKGGMTEKDFSSHVVYVSGQKNNSGNKTGARCVADILVSAGFLNEENGRLAVANTPTDPPPEAEGEQVVQAPLKPQSPLISDRSRASTTATQVPPVLPILAGAIPQIAINIQLHLPETENAEVYDKLFKALRENLLSPKIT